MSFQLIREINSVSFVLTLYLYTFHVCHSVSLGQREDDFTSHRVQGSTPSRSWKKKIKQGGDVYRGKWRSDERVVKSANLDASERSPPQKVRRKSSDLPWKPLSYSNAQKLDKTGGNVAASSLYWTAGNVTLVPRSKVRGSEDGYQADFAGFPRVQGKVLGPSDSSPHLSDWYAIRPGVQCEDGAMTFTASGQGVKHLFVYRKGASPISPVQLPQNCGYSVRMSSSNLEMMVAYDACYIIQKNGSYGLPMLWWGSPLKLSCPVKFAPAPLSTISMPSVSCSSFAMAVQIYGHKVAAKLLGVMVNGGWGPFVSRDCAYRDSSQPKELTFFVPYGAACIAIGDELHLHLALDEQEYLLSCPTDPQVRQVHSPTIKPTLPTTTSVDPKFTSVPDPGTTTTSTSLPTQMQTSQLTQLPQYPKYPQGPQVYPPGSQPARPPQPPPGSPPGLPSPPPQFIYPIVPGKWPYFPLVPPKYPYPPYQSPVVAHAFKLPVKPSPYLYGPYYPHVSLKLPPVTPDPKTAATTSTTTTTTTTTTTEPPTSPLLRPPSTSSYPPYYFKVPYYYAPTAAPATKAPNPLSPPKRPVGARYHKVPFYSPGHYSPYIPYGPISYPQPSLMVPSPSPLPPTTTTRATKMMVLSPPDGPSYPSGSFYPQRPIFFPLPAPLPPMKGKPYNLVAPQATCHFHAFCSLHHFSYHFLYQPYYHPFYLMPQYSDIQLPSTTKRPLKTTTTTSTTPPTTATLPTPSEPTLKMPYVQCVMGWVTVFLPFAHPDSIQIRAEQMNTWLFLSSVSPLCGYMIQMAEGSGVILHSPLPACHSQSQTPTTISLTLRFWDLSTGQYRIVEPQCSYDSPSQIPAPLQQPVSPSPLTTNKETIPPILLPKPKVSCSSHQMDVGLPPGPISGIVVKDIKGNQINLQDAPKHCGYSASEGKDGKIHLSLQLHSHCQMSVQGKMYIITVVYTTVNGIREGQFSCPVVSSGAMKECNLTSEQRLPCGSSPVSQTQCISMGCCFSKHPPACYYPMDECTLDRHFVFSVPASLTEPPLSPSMLVTAGNSTCKPARVTSDLALFKIPMDDCGTRRLMVGRAVIYIVEIINKVQSISLNYGTITRDSPVRLLVECRYLPGTVLSVSYLVKTPTLGPGLQSQGTFGVQLRIAKDAEYSSYYPQYHQPLQMLLGKPLYLEVRLLNNPDPNLVLLVHFCVAYPRSATAVWVLLYNGCPNPLDPALQQAVLSEPQTSSPRSQTRRFTIETFQFLPDGEFMDPDEEIYFMCSTEICSPRDGPCVEGCFGQ